MILTVGATGNVGRELVFRLVVRGHPVRAVSRDPGGARAVLPAEVDIRAFDGDWGWADVEAVFVPQGFVPPSVFAAAALAGVKRVVYVSSYVAARYPDSPVGQSILDGERAVLDSGLAWTVLRPWELQSNVLAWAPGVRADGVVRLPAVGRPSPAVDPADLAEVAARALVDARHEGRTYHLTGPAELTAAAKVRLLGEALGRELSLVVAGERPLDPDPVVESTLVPGVCGLDSPGVSDAVASVVGRPARGFAQWARRHASAFTG